MVKYLFLSLFLGAALFQNKSQCFGFGQIYQNILIAPPKQDSTVCLNCSDYDNKFLLIQFENQCLCDSSQISELLANLKLDDRSKLYVPLDSGKKITVNDINYDPKTHTPAKPYVKMTFLLVAKKNGKKFDSKSCEELKALRSNCFVKYAGPLCQTNGKYLTGYSYTFSFVMYGYTIQDAEARLAKYNVKVTQKNTASFDASFDIAAGTIVCNQLNAIKRDSSLEDVIIYPRIFSNKTFGY